jgi:hypothetical protein
MAATSTSCMCMLVGGGSRLPSVSKAERVNSSMLAGVNSISASVGAARSMVSSWLHTNVEDNQV